MGGSWSEFWNATEESEPFQERQTETKIDLEVPKISIHEIIKLLTKEETNEDEEEEEEVKATLLELLTERGYVVITFDDTAQLPAEYQDLQSKIKQLIKVSNGFFAQQLEEKRKYSDSGKGNRGYVLIEGLREGFKLRRADKEKAPAIFAKSFDPLFELMMHLSWTCFVSMFNETATAHNPQDLTELRKSIEGSVKICMDSYFAPTLETQNDFCAENSKLKRLDKLRRFYPPLERPEDLANFKVVCGTHQDSGIFTFAVANDVPGLQVFDKAFRAWVSVDQITSPNKDVIIMAGQKAAMYVTSEGLEPTTQRVVLKQGTGRTSFTFTFDTQ